MSTPKIDQSPTRNHWQLDTALVHLDLDVLEPAELKTAVASDPDGLTLTATSRLINDIAERYDLIGLTVAEPMPREVIKLRRLLHSLPLMQ